MASVTASENIMSLMSENDETADSETISTRGSPSKNNRPQKRQRVRIRVRPTSSGCSGPSGVMSFSRGAAPAPASCDENLGEIGERIDLILPQDFNAPVAASIRASMKTLFELKEFHDSLTNAQLADGNFHTGNENSSPNIPSDEIVGYIEQKKTEFARHSLVVEDWVRLMNIDAPEFSEFVQKYNSMFEYSHDIVLKSNLRKNRVIIANLSKKKPSDYETLVRYLRFTISNDDLRLKGESLFCRIKTREGGDTSAWKEHMKLIDYIWGKARTSIHWGVSIRERTTDNIKHYFMSSKDPVLPALVSNKSYMSYANCMYDAEEQIAIEYPLAADTPYRTMAYNAPAKHFPNIEFPTDFWTQLKDGTLSWREIPTPAFNRIFETQKLPQEVIDFVHILFGRCFYDNGKHDCWQVVFWIVGYAGTGKSTLINLLKSYFQEEDIGNISNNIERQFGLGSIDMDQKKIFVAPEISNDFKMEISELLSMVTPGETVTIAKKNKNAVVSDIKATGIICGNNFPDNIAPGSVDAIMRRVMLLRFEQGVVCEDPDMDTKLQNESAMIFLKCTWAYRSYVSDKGNKKNIWSHTPKYFVETRSVMEGTIDHLRYFIKTKMSVHKDYKINFDEFQQEFNESARQNKAKTTRLVESNYGSIFHKYNLSVKEDATGNKVIYGMRIREYEAEQVDPSDDY